MARPTVEMPRWVFATLLGSFLLTLLTLVFLLGRMSVEVLPPPAPSSPAPVAVDRPPHPVELQVASPTPVAVSTPTATPEPEEPPPPRFAQPERKAVRAYLDEVEGLTADSAELGDPTEFATTLLGQAAAGDTSAFDPILAQVEEAQKQLRQVKPPGPCKEHYRLLSSQLKSSLGLLQKVRKALLDMDTAALAGLAVQGQRMQGQTRRLDALTRKLRRQSAD